MHESPNWARRIPIGAVDESLRASLGSNSSSRPAVVLNAHKAQKQQEFHLSITLAARCMNAFEPCFDAISALH